MPNFPSSQGTTFSFDGDTFQCMDISVSSKAPEPKDASDPAAGGNKIEVSTLDLADGSDKVYQTAPLLEPDVAVDDEDNPIVTTTVTIQFRGSTRPTAGVTGELDTTDATGTFKCTESALTRKVGQFVEGSATFVSVATFGS